LRNPFTFAFQSETGRLFINDVGGIAEEINEGFPGANYGWPIIEHGPTKDPRFRGPIHHYPTACIIGAAFAPAGLDWPKEYRGQYFFADFNHGWIKTIDPAHPAAARTFATGLRRPVDLRFAQDGSLFVLLRDAWVIDPLFKGGTGSLVRIRYLRKK
jgi:glucose/arabinose dehydrogenase